LSSSWDRSLRLWDLRIGKTTERFVGHTKEVLSCSFSADNRQILSSGADRVIKLWNVKGACRFTSANNNHNDWVSNVKFLGRNTTKGNFANSFFASTGWDGKLKIWNNQSFDIKDSFKAHDGNINAVTTSPKGNFIVTGGKDKKVKVWDFNDCSNSVAEFDAGSVVSSLAFNPKSSWVAIGTENGIKIWDFEAKENSLLAEQDYEIEVPKKIVTEDPKAEKKTKSKKYHQVTSIQWNATGTRLFVGFSNGVIRVYDAAVENISN
jgi:guanine nucleotide-binding protein subunit beta-2-like 1 protein